MPAYKVLLKKKTLKQYKALPQAIQEAFQLLAAEIEVSGPVRTNWRNYGILVNTTKHHCHLGGRRPTYVAIWEVGEVKKIEEDDGQGDQEIQEVIFIYLGTHEKAGY